MRIKLFAFALLAVSQFAVAQKSATKKKTSPSDKSTLTTAKIPVNKIDKAAGTKASGEVKTTPESKVDKLSYAIGVNFAKQFQSQNIEINPDMMFQAIKAIYSGGTPVMNEQQVMETLQNFEKEMQEKIQPLPFTSGYQAYTGATGTRNVVNVLGHGMAIDFHHAIGSKQVEARCRSLSGHLRNRLSENSHLTLLTPTQPELAPGLVSFRLKKSTAGEVFTRLQKDHNILVKVVAKPEYNALRFSTHLYNNEEEVDRTSKAIEGIL